MEKQGVISMTEIENRKLKRKLRKAQNENKEQKRKLYKAQNEISKLTDSLIKALEYSKTVQGNRKKKELRIAFKNEKKTTVNE